VVRVKLYYRLNLARDKDILKGCTEKFDGVVIDAHVYETFKNSLSAFIASLPSSHTFMIDPITYKFSIPEITLEYSEKPWFGKLLDYYKIPITEDEPYLNPVKISKNDFIEIVSNVVKYQKNVVPVNIKNALGLARFFKLQIEEKTVEPEYIIPPYLIIEDSELASYRDFLKFNVEAIKYSKRILKDSPCKILGVIPIGEMSFLDFNVLSEVIEKYSNTPADAYAVWVSGLNEVTKNPLLRVFTLFLFELKNKVKKDIINLYGGYFSLILGSRGLLNGVVHGVGYAEYRDPYGASGIAGLLYYNPLTHTFDTIERIKIIYASDPSTKCSCPVCQRYPLETFESIKNNVSDLLSHFVNVRFDEKTKLERMSTDEIIATLKKDSEKIERIFKMEELKISLRLLKSLSKLRYQHLNSWRYTLEAVRELIKSLSN